MVKKELEQEVSLIDQQWEHRKLRKIKKHLKELLVLEKNRNKQPQPKQQLNQGNSIIQQKILVSVSKEEEHHQPLQHPIIPHQV